MERRYSLPIVADSLKEKPRRRRGFRSASRGLVAIVIVLVADLAADLAGRESSRMDVAVRRVVVERFDERGEVAGSHALRRRSDHVGGRDGSGDRASVR